MYVFVKLISKYVGLFLITITALAVLRKHYHMLLASLPEDHVTTIGILSENVEIDETFFNEMLSLTDHSVANEKILNAVILMVNRDTQIRGFSQLLKLLMKSDCRSSHEMRTFEIGKFTHVYTCTYMHAYLRTYVYRYIHTYIHTHTRTYTHTHTHIHTVPFEDKVTLAFN